MPQDPAQPAKDPMVTANPPAVAEPGTLPPAPSAPLSQAKPVAAAARDQQRPKMSKSSRRVSEETVISRARRLMRAEMKKVAQALGLENYDPNTVNAKLEELKKARESGMSINERYEQQLNELRAQNQELNAQLGTATGELQKHRKDLVQAQKAQERLQVEYEIRTIASKAGINDLDYGVHLLKQHIKALPADQQVLNDEAVRVYFEGLKKDPGKRYLFQEERVPAGPQSVADEKTKAAASAVAAQPTAQQPGQPAQTQIPGQGAPTPATGAAGEKKEVNALEMGKRDFNAHTREKYNYSPGMA